MTNGSETGRQGGMGCWGMIAIAAIVIVVCVLLYLVVV